MGMNIIPPTKFLFRILVAFFLILHYKRSEAYSNCDVEQLARDLIFPAEGNTMHAASLRNQLRRLLLRDHDVLNENYQSLDDTSVYGNGLYEDKRSFRSLLRDRSPQSSVKRNINSLAKAGAIRSSMYDYIKRSIATLAKNGQLPSREPDADSSSSDTWRDEKKSNGLGLNSGFIYSGKRNVASLARKYELPGNFGKRNIQSLVRTGMIPSSIAPKRSLQSLARSNTLPFAYLEPKRNVATLARDWALPQQQTKYNSDKRDYLDSDADLDVGYDEKRNIQSLKNSQLHGRKKRYIFNDNINGDDNLEYLESNQQNGPFEYEELVDAMNEAYPYYNNDDKRFLVDKRHIGALAKHGLLRSDIMNEINGRKFAETPNKRHIASLARSGLLPTAYRSGHGGNFYRSGRARSRIAGSFPPPERLRQPLAGVCRRCNSEITIRSSWGAPGLQSTWGSTPPRVTAVHWRNHHQPIYSERRRF